MGSDTKRPTGDGDKSGTWTYSSGSTGYNLIDETSADDNDYIVSPATTTTYYHFTYSAFSVPVGATNITVTVRLRHRDSAATGTNKVAGALKVNGTRYNHSSNTECPGYTSAYSDTDFSWSTNPDTGAAWTVSEVNGIQSFGVYSTDSNPQFRISQAYISVSYTDPPASFAGLGCNIGGTWKYPATVGDISVNIGGTWKSATNIYVNIGGVWKEAT